MAFQPALLRAEGWSRIMTGFGDHFGEDTSLSDALASETRDYFVANAGQGVQREHRFSPSVWRQKEVGSKANCDA